MAVITDTIIHHEGSGVVGRFGDPAAADNPYLGEAAAAGREQAGAVLRPRGDRGGGDHRRRDRGRRHRAAIEAAVGDGSAFGFRVTYIRQEAPLGLAHAVLVARDFLGDDDFVMYLGDNFIVGGIRAGRGVPRRAADAQIMLTKVPTRGSSGSPSSTRRPGGRLEEKPQEPKSDLALVGVYIFTAAIHEAVGDSSRRGGASLRSPRRSSGCSITARPCTRGHHRVLEGHRERHGHAGGQPAGAGRPSSRGIDGTVGTGLRDHRPGRDRSGRARVRIPDRRAGRHRRRDEGDGSYIGPYTAIADGCAIDDSEIEYSICSVGRLDPRACAGSRHP